MRFALFSAAVFAAVLALCPVSVAAAATKRNDNPPGPQPSNTQNHQGDNDFRVVRKRDGSLQLPVVPPEADLSPILCPLSMNVCPISETVPTTLEEWVEHGYECVDVREDLNSCGGCGSVDVQYDCTAIPNALGISCEVGACRVHSCKPGFTLALDGTSCVSTA
ncbi:hypothetical protein DAEQUDRAFT_662375 [Daedalea quercina L-15889]|uniref:Protein CPL1-like domain-containing protein n=1 Tax=Daedalea quercina L-15889 TaxID=1314783 RepID=A0A165TDN3_9APHY|nr:hypothetical protein DAEQUDRAFT_662375 [Daedalea quercina L-15889]